MQPPRACADLSCSKRTAVGFHGESTKDDFFPTVIAPLLILNSQGNMNRLHVHKHAYAFS